MGDLQLGSHESFRHCRFWNEKGPRYLERRKPDERSERQRHTSVEGQCRVTAREDEPQTVVDDAALIE